MIFVSGLVRTRAHILVWRFFSGETMEFLLWIRVAWVRILLMDVFWLINIHEQIIGDKENSNLNSACSFVEVK